jgi:hypothetical protein
MAMPLIEHAQQQQLVTAALGMLIHSMGVYVWARGMGLPRARELHEQAVAMVQRLHEGDHFEVAYNISNLPMFCETWGNSDTPRPARAGSGHV